MAKMTKSCVEGGVAKVLIGARLSKDYASYSMEIGLEAPLVEGATHEQAMQELLTKASEFFQANEEPVMTLLTDYSLTAQKKSRSAK